MQKLWLSNAECKEQECPGVPSRAPRALQIPPPGRLGSRVPPSPRCRGAEADSAGLRAGSSESGKSPPSRSARAPGGRRRGRRHRGPNRRHDGGPQGVREHKGGTPDAVGGQSSFPGEVPGRPSPRTISWPGMAFLGSRTCCGCGGPANTRLPASPPRAETPTSAVTRLLPAAHPPGQCFSEGKTVPTKET